MQKPKIDPSVFVAKGAVVLGDVTMDKNCSVWYNATVRSTESYITIGEGSNVQDNAVIHVGYDNPTIIGVDIEYLLFLIVNIMLIEECFHLLL